MAKGKLDTPILGVALGIELKTASTGPFAQFQNCGDDDESLTKLVFQLVNRIPGSEPDRDTIKFQVGKFKSAVTPILQALAAPATADPAPTRQNLDEIENSSAKLFEEIKIMFQDLPSRIEKNGSLRGGKRRRRFHSGMFEEILFTTKNPFLGVRAGLSLMRDAMPWIYDEGCGLVNKMQATKSHEVRMKLLTEFEDLLMVSTHSGFAEQYLLESEDDYRLFRELPRMLVHALVRATEEKPA